MIIPLITSSLLLGLAFSLVRKNRGWMAASVVAGIPLAVNVIDYFVPGNLTTFRQIVLIIYGLSLIYVSIYNSKRL